MIVFSIVSTKGGVGKTTFTANFGALLTDLGMRVLLIDADVQPSLSRYFPLKHKAVHGLTEMIKRGMIEVAPEIRTVG
jgi:chromosome partitioning related protein ParA